MLTAAKSKFAALASTIAVAAALAAPAHVLAQELRPLFRFQVQSAGSSGGQTGGPQNPPTGTLSVNLSPAQATLFVGQPYVAQASVLGHAGPIAYALIPVTGSANTPGLLGLTFDNATGTMSGTLSAASGVFSFQVQATDPATGAVGTSQTVSVQAVLPSVSFSPGNVTGLTAGVPFSSPAPSTNVPSPTFSPGPFFPTWASLNPTTGVISGTPTVASAGYAHPLNIQATNGSVTGSGTYSVSVLAHVGSITYAGGPVSLVWGETFSSPAPTSPLSQGVFSAGGSGFPAWATINSSTGVISGTVPPNSGNTQVTLTASAIQDKATASGSWVVNIAAPFVSVANAPERVVAGGFVSFFATTNIPGPVTWSMANAPAWLTINSSTGAITGTANGTTQVSNAVVRATRGSITATATLSISEPTPISLSYQNQNPPVDTNQLFSAMPFVNGGGAGQNVFTISAGSLPSGLTLNSSTGEIRGFATGSGNFPVTIRVTDGATSATFPMTLRVQTVVASNQCYGPGDHSFTVPAYNTLRFDMTAAGGQGGGVTNQAGTFSNNSSGGSVSFTLRGRTVFVPGGRGGGTTSLTQTGTMPLFPAPALTGDAPLAGTRQFDAGTSAVDGFRTSGTIPANPARGAATLVAAAVQPTMPAFGAGAYSTAGSPAGLGTGGAGQCYAPSAAQLGAWGNHGLLCGSGGGSGSRYRVTYSRLLGVTETNFPATGNVVSFSIPPAPSPSAGPGQMCITVE